MSKILERVFYNVKKDALLSVSDVLVMVVTFFLLGAFVSVVFATQTAIEFLEKQAQVTVFFKDDFTEPSILSLRDKYSSDARILDVKYVSKQDAYKIFTEMNKDETVLLESVSANILPASLELRTKNIKDLSGVAEEFNGLDGVEEVKYFKEVIERFRFWSSIIFVAGFILVFIFTLISYTVVIATLRITIDSKGTEFEIMKLVGASDSYVKKPLIYQGVVFGLVSAFISGLILTCVLLVLQFALGWKGFFIGFGVGIELVPVVFGLLLWVFLLIFGALLGFFGSYTAVKKYLNY